MDSVTPLFKAAEASPPPPHTHCIPPRCHSAVAFVFIVTGSTTEPSVVRYSEVNIEAITEEVFPASVNHLLVPL